jgi:tetratricopeptide (TPR) repeat protein
MTAPQPPDPGPARTLDDLVDRLRSLKIWAGDPSYETITDRINAAWSQAGRPAGELARKNTVADCFRTGRRRINTDLVVAVIEALHPDAGYVAHWRQALRVALAETQAAAQVRAQDSLPADLTEFTGRDAELARVAELAGSTGGLVTIEGMAGVGKTRLAIHAGHVLHRQRPFDHILFVDLRGFHPDPGQPPADPGAVLDSFLRLLGVPGQQVPHSLNGRITKYRERVGGRRVLVVLDNAADESQAEPLLPGAAGCVVLITSRRSLAKLLPGLHLQLEVFTPDAAVGLLTRAVPQLPADDGEAMRRVAHRCGYLPLALGLVAGHMRGRPDWTPADHADWLDERHRAGRLDDGLALALNLSYQHLPADRRRLLRLLALHPGQDFDGYAAAALAGTGLGTATEHLLQLSDDNMLQRGTPGRFGFHDLVRADAAGRATDEERPVARREALGRLLDYYLHTAAAALDVVSPAEHDHRPGVTPPATAIPPLSDADEARGWLDTERDNLIATAGHAAVNGWPGYTAALAATIYRYLDLGGHLGDAVILHTQARRAARETGDREGEAHALNNLGGGYRRQGRYPLAIHYFQEALTLYRETGDQLGEARALGNLSVVSWRLGRYRQAADYAQQALDRYAEVGDRLGEARAAVNIGGAWWRLGDYPRAVERFQYALNQFRELAARQDECAVQSNLGLAYERMGRYADAVEQHSRSLALSREIGNRIGEAQALTDLGTAYRLLGRTALARDHVERAIAMFRDMHDQGSEAEALDGLGECLLDEGRPEEARGHHAAALDLAVEIQDQYEQARAHRCLARTYAATGDREAALRHWEQALVGYAELGVPEADEVRAEMRG